MPLRFPYYDRFDPSRVGRIFPGTRRMPLGMARSDLHRVAACSKKLEEAKHDRDEAIVEASKSGETYRDIARYAGISYSRVAQIVTAWRRELPES